MNMLKGRTLTENASMFVTAIIGAAIIFQVLPTLNHTPLVKPTATEVPVPETPQKMRTMTVVILPPPPPSHAPSPKVLPPEITSPTKTAPKQKTPAAKPEKEKPRVEKPSPKLTEPTQVSVKIETAKEDAVKEGRVLLKLLETGKGPDVEIAWPEHSDQKRKLFEAFETCLGLQTGLMTKLGTIYVAGGRRGHPKKINPDRTSLFLRQSTGALPSKEIKQHAAIRVYHSLSGGEPVRLFARVVDAALLGGLFQLVPAKVKSGVRVRGQYGLKAGAITIERISVNGVKQTGKVEIRTSLLGLCR